MGRSCCRRSTAPAATTPATWWPPISAATALPIWSVNRTAQPPAGSKISSVGDGVLGLDLGLGNGTFASQLVTYATAETSGSLAVGDFDGDGRPDVAFAGFDYVESGGVGPGLALPAPEPADYGLNIFLNTGGGAFAAPATYANPQSFQSIATGDFDGDGHLDLVGLTWTNAPAFGVYLNAGDGTFGTETSFVDGNGFGNYGLAVGDFDGDGKNDVAVITVLNPNQSNERHRPRALHGHRRRQLRRAGAHDDRQHPLRLPADHRRLQR